MINIFSRTKTMTVSEFFELKKPKYTTLQIIPHTGNRNYDTEILAASIADMYKLPYQRLQKDINKSGFKITYQLPEKSTFVINVTKKDCRFYLVVPKRYATLFIEKCSEVWKKANIIELDKIPNIEGIKYELGYTKEDALSLKANKKSNDPLNSLLNVKTIMEADDEINILYNFLPSNQQRWPGLYKGTMKRLNADLPVNKEKLSPESIVRYAAIGLINGIDFILNMISSILNNEEPQQVKEVALTKTDKEDSLSKITRKKKDSTIVNTQIIVSSKSEDKERQINNALAVCDGFKVINDDNSLQYKKMNDKAQINVTDFKIEGASINKTSTLECNNFIQIPGRELLDKHNIETKIEVLDNPVPEELTKGNICLGDVHSKTKHKGYLPTDYNFANLALLLLSPQGGGKTTLISNIASDANKAKEGNILLDYIKNCELAESVKSVIPKEDVIEIDLSKEEDFQALAFNEIKPTGTSEFELFEVANMKAEQTLAFIDSANSDGLPLTGKMRRYLSAASNVVYLHCDTSIGDVIKCLSKHQRRIEYIEWARKNISDNGQLYLEDMLDTLEELNEVEVEIDKKSKEVLRREVVGTKDSKIEGILDRVNLIQENIYLKYMLNMKSDKNVDFIKAMEEGKTILIKMPEHKYNNMMVKNVLITFFTSKIVLATKLRGSLHEQPSRCNVFYDEIYQAPTAENIICSVLSQLRKFGTKIIISAHYMDQLNNKLKNEIKASGASYMLLQGADKKNFDELKEELHPYELEDLLRMKQFHSLNLIRYKNGYAKFITALPKPLVE